MQNTKILYVYASIFCLTLGGCHDYIAEQQARKQQALDAASAMDAECKAKYTKQVEYLKCSQQEVEILERGGGLNVDLLRLWYAKRIEIAERLEKKQITKSEANVENAQIDTYITNETNRRQAATWQMMQSMMPPAPTTTNCIPNGYGGVTCRSY